MNNYARSPKPHMKVFHLQANAAAFKPKVKRIATCADCRHSHTELQARIWAFVCDLALTATPQTCAAFRDSRVPLCANYGQIQ